jgi:hypothetical protein
MKKNIFKIAFTLTTIVILSLPVYIKNNEPAVKITTMTVEQLVHKYAGKYKVSAKEMMGTIRCENSTLDPKLQSNHRYPKDSKKWKVKKGEREKSFGIVQIHLPDHSDVSYQQATDPEYSVEFMAKKFAKKRQHEWSCYRKLY